MPTDLPARRPLDAEHHALAVRLRELDRLVAAARLDPEVRLRTLLRARFGLWLIRRQAQRLARRFSDEQS